MGTQIQFRRGTAAEWTAADTLLLAGEIGFETNTRKFKIGDGTNKWTSLDYVVATDANAVAKALYDAYSILMATSDNTPVAITVAEQTVVGRLTGGAIKALSIAELQALMLSTAIPEDITFILDAVLSGDEHWCGMAEIGTMGYAATVGDLIYLAVADGKWEKAQADVEAKSAGKLGLCLATTAENSTCLVLLWGKIRSAQFPAAFTVGAPVYVSAVTAGKVVVAAPTGTTGFIVRIIGYGNTAEDLYFCPDNTYLELA